MVGLKVWFVLFSKLHLTCRIFRLFVSCDIDRESDIGFELEVIQKFKTQQFRSSVNTNGDKSGNENGSIKADRKEDPKEIIATKVIGIVRWLMDGSA